MPTKRVYFDSHVYDLLIKAENEAVRNGLLALIRSRQCDVYGSLATLEELGVVSEKNERRCRSLIDCFWSCVRTRVLLDRSRLLQAELRKSNRLTMSEACFARDYIRSRIKPATYDHRLLQSLAQDVRREKHNDARDMNQTFAETEREINALIDADEQYKDPSAAKRHQLWLRAVTDDQIQGWVDRYCERNGAQSVSHRRLPCMSALVAWMIARAKMNLRTGKCYESSASHDRDHFVHATQAGTLVTGDRALASTIASIDVRLATVETPQAFFNWAKTNRLGAS